MNLSEFKQCVSLALAKFKEVMPPLPTFNPEICVTTKRTYKGLRAKIAKELGAPELSGPPESEYPIEPIADSKGFVFLLRSEMILDDLPDDKAVMAIIWQNIGSIYAAMDAGMLGDEKRERRKSKDNKHDLIMGAGRNFWYRFVGVAIGNYIEEKMAKTTAPEKRDWPFEEWALMSDFVAVNLRYVFRAIREAEDEPVTDEKTAIEYSQKVSDIDVATFFANLLTDVNIKDYMKAAQERRLVISNKDLNMKLVSHETDKVYVTEDPTHFSELDNALKIPLWKIMSILGKQVEKEKFWREDPVLIENLGLLTGELHGRICEVIMRTWKQDGE